jgi:UDP-glucose 4-epimerase
MRRNGTPEWMDAQADEPMIKHGNTRPTVPQRAVIIGAHGFIGAAITRRLKALGAPVIALGRSEVDLLSDTAADQLAGYLQKGDSLVLVSARAPVKNHAMLVENLSMLGPIIAATQLTPPDHLVYISSDAVYRDSMQPLDETSPADPGSLHGVMHRARELVLETEVAGPLGIPLAILRPTLVYGALDPHNGYGPNRFRRLAETGADIVLFGEGEERRDHVDVDDVAELATRLVMHRSEGVLNAATGTVTSFREVAEQVVALSGRQVPIKGSPRIGAMPHNGYRPFDPSETARAFPDFTYTSLEDGLARARDEARRNERGAI